MSWNLNKGSIPYIYKLKTNEISINKILLYKILKITIRKNKINVDFFLEGKS